MASVSSNSEIVLITGANTGIGYQIVRALCEAIGGAGSKSYAYEVVLGGRSLSKVEAAIASAVEEFPAAKGHLHAVQVDLESDSSIQQAHDVIKERFGRIDVLVNNAGGQFDQYIGSGQMSAREAWHKTWDVNVVGTQILTGTLMPLLLGSANPRLLFLASGTSTLAESTNLAVPVNAAPTGRGWPKAPTDKAGIPAYRCAKTGLNMAMREWCRLLHPDGVKVWSLSPGFLATGLGGNTALLKAMGAGDPTTAGPFVRSVIQGERDADVGKVIAATRVQPW